MRLRSTIMSLIHLAFVWAAVSPVLAQHPPIGSDDTLGRAFKDRATNIQVEGEGIVTTVLADDRDGRVHQRFIIRLRSGQTLLVTHNVDIAPRVLGLKARDVVRFNGEYEWNPKGGVIHWTHRDPMGKHAGGWLKHKGKTYQ